MKITWIAKNEYGWEVQPKPIPAMQMVPQWWKDMPPFTPSAESPEGKKFIISNRDTNKTAKKCVPMLDIMTSGYIITLFADVQVTQTSEGPGITWRLRSGDVFVTQGPNGQLLPPPTGYSKNVFKYLNTWIPTTPKGYSTLFVSPLGYRDLPFHAIPAIIDSDKSKFEVAAPMWLKEGFEGVIPKGTPMLQVIPFKREDWTSEFTYFKDGEYEKHYDKHLGADTSGLYLKRGWSKKEYK